jgi:non-ribosomal peptide synthetase component F
MQRRRAAESATNLITADRFPDVMRPETVTPKTTFGEPGNPEGVMNTHRGILNRLHWMQATLALDGTDSVLQKTPFSFDVSVWEFFWPLIAGARLVVARRDGHKDPAYFSETFKSTALPPCTSCRRCSTPSWRSRRQPSAARSNA